MIANKQKIYYKDFFMEKGALFLPDREIEVSKKDGKKSNVSKIILSFSTPHKEFDYPKSFF